MKSKAIVFSLILLFVLFIANLVVGVYYYQQQVKEVLNLKDDQFFLQRKLRKVENFLDLLNQKLRNNEKRLRTTIEELNAEKQENEKILSKVKELEKSLKELYLASQNSLREIQELRFTLQNISDKLQREKKRLTQKGVNLGEVSVKKSSK